MAKTNKKITIEKGNDVYEINIDTNTDPIEKMEGKEFHSTILITKNNMVVSRELFVPVLNKDQIEEGTKNSRKWVENHARQTTNF